MQLLPNSQQAVSSFLYSMLNIAIEGAGHNVINAGALAAKSTITLFNTWIISPIVWYILGKTANATTYVAKNAATGTYHFFCPEDTTQSNPILLIEDKQEEMPEVV